MKAATTPITAAARVETIAGWLSKISSREAVDRTRLLVGA
jgi:hypothetical protein